MSAVFNSSPVSPNQAPPSGPRAVLPRRWHDAWRWWSGEMHDFFAPFAERYWADRSGLLTLTVPVEGEPAWPAQLGGRDWQLMLDPALVLEKTATYPAAVEENLGEVVLNDLDRQTPFRAEQIYLAHRVADRHEGADGVARIDVTLSMVLKAAIAPVLQKIRDAGGTVYSIRIKGDQRHIEFLPAEERRARRLTRLQKINIGLAVALLLLLLAVIVVPILQRRAEVRELAPQVGKAQTEAEVTRKIETEYQRLMQEYQLAQARKYQGHQVLAIVEEMTRLSPDTTWLQSLEMKAPPGGKSPKGTRELIITGEAASASKMIELLEQSPLLQNTTQRAQTTRGAQPNTERFQIATELKPRVAPETVDLLQPPATTAPAVPVVPPGPPVPEPAKVETKPAGKADAKADAKADTKDAPKADAKSDNKADTKAAPKADTKVDSKAADAKSAPKMVAPSPAPTPTPAAPLPAPTPTPAQPVQTPSAGPKPPGATTTTKPVTTPGGAP